MSSTFTDNFSKQSDAYLRYRPTYPSDLFAYLASLTEGHNLAWDCGTGNGQCAIGLAKYFQNVYATDPSDQQVRNALPHEQVVYRVERAEQCGLSDHSADLVTIAQALHWFDFEVFYREVRRVLKPNGVIAAWCYGLPSVSPEIDRVIRHFHDDMVGQYWQPQNRMIENDYASIPFPFTDLEPPVFYMHKQVTAHDMLGLFKSWSAVQKYMDQRGSDPIALIEQELLELWGDPEIERTVTWRIVMKAGRSTHNPGE